MAEHVDKESEPPPKRPKEDGLMSLLDSILSSPTLDIPSHQQKASNEIQKYLCIDCALDQKPLLWWNNYNTQLPLMAKLARNYLCIPATSVSSERAFSTAGNIVSAKRSCLLPEHVDMLVFLAHNLD